MNKPFQFEITPVLTTILDNVDVGIAIYDAKGNYVFVNTALIKWRNISRQQFLTMNVHDFKDVLDTCVFDLVCQEKKKVNRLQYYGGYQARSVGEHSTRTRIVTGIPIFDNYGNIRYVVTTLQDVHRFDALRQKLLTEHKVLLSTEVKGSERVKIIAQAPAIKQLLSVADNVAPLDTTVLLYGESGSGKEVAAHYIHENSMRKNKEMVIVNCAALPDNLIESELFGYEKGSFTGASAAGKAGLIELADGGTLFLDEINSLPVSIQGKLLRVVDEKKVRRVGSTKSRDVNFRLIAASNRDLGKMVLQGTFREDLYYRLHVVPLTIPPLRNRREDIKPLCHEFLQYFGEKYHIKKSFSEQVLQTLYSYDWPGNVRQLRNFVERMVVTTPAASETIFSIPDGILTTQGNTASNAEPPKSPEGKKLSKEEIMFALSLFGCHRGKTAEYLGISRRYLQYKIKEYHIPSRCKYHD